MTAQEHAAQKALVLAAEMRSQDTTERHNAYPAIRKPAA
jgi:hypothetical protein